MGLQFYPLFKDGLYFTITQFVMVTPEQVLGILSLLLKKWEEKKGEEYAIYWY